MGVSELRNNGKKGSKAQRLVSNEMKIKCVLKSGSRCVETILGVAGMANGRLCLCLLFVCLCLFGSLFVCVFGFVCVCSCLWFVWFVPLFRLFRVWFICMSLFSLCVCVCVLLVCEWGSFCLLVCICTCLYVHLYLFHLRFCVLFVIFFCHVYMFVSEHACMYICDCLSRGW